MITEQKQDTRGHFTLIRHPDEPLQPEISVVMSVYNGSEYLEESLDSVLGQSFDHFEAILIDDGSTDQSREIIERKMRDDPRIRLACQENIGLTPSLNRGLNLCRAGLIARQDADDISLPERFERQRKYLMENPKVGMVNCRTEFFNQNGKLRDSEMPRLTPKEIPNYLVRKNIFVHGAAMFRHDAVQKIGGYREFFRCAQDYDLWLRLAEHSQLACLDECLYRYRVVAQAVSVARRSTQQRYARLAGEFARQRKERGKDDYEQYVQDFPDGLQTETVLDNRNYHLSIAAELIGGNQLKQARKELVLAFKAGARNPEWLSLFVKTLLGAKGLDALRAARNKLYKR